jgi:hypothetical protein
MSAQLYLKEMQDYQEILSTKHQDILHTIDGRRSFARFQTDEHIEEIQQRGGKNIVVVADYYGQVVGDPDDQKIRQVMKIRFACKAQGTDQATAIDAAEILAQTIMFDFMSRMRHDYENDNCGILRYVEFEKMSWEAFEGPWLDSFYGFDLEVSFKAYLPAFDENKWTDQGAMLVLGTLDNPNMVLAGQGENLIGII